MKNLWYIFLLSLAVQFDATPAKKNSGVFEAARVLCSLKAALVKKSGYTWNEQFIESLENGEDKVQQYFSKKTSITKVDKVSGLTPLEIAVSAGNYGAIESILDIAAKHNKKLAIYMALNLAHKKNDAIAEQLLMRSLVIDEDGQ